MQSALQFLRQENSRIQLRGTVASETWLNEPLLPSSKVESQQGTVYRKRVALISDFRKFVSGCQIVDVKVTEIGGRMWKSEKATAGYVVRRQQEIYRRLCHRKSDLLDDLKSLAVA